MELHRSRPDVKTSNQKVFFNDKGEAVGFSEEHEITAPSPHDPNTDITISVTSGIGGQTSVFESVAPDVLKRLNDPKDKLGLKDIKRQKGAIVIPDAASPQLPS